MTCAPADILAELIRIPSVNPMGAHELGGIYGERALTGYLEGWCAEARLNCLRQPVLPGRDNLLAVLPGEPNVADGGPMLLWEVHQDTVAVEGMTVEPFGGVVRDGRVYGRGACDVKGGMAAMLAALARLAHEHPAGRPTILLALCINEEFGFTGAKALTRLWQPAESHAATEPIDLRPLVGVPAIPDAAIVAEPTDLNLVVAHKGVVRWRCHTLGRAAHTSNPDLGANAVYAMATVVAAIERFHREVAPRLPSDPLCGRGTACVSTIRGGVGVNTVPERATIEIDRRLSPLEQPRVAYHELVDYIAGQAELGPCRLVHDEPFMESRGLANTENRAWAARLQHLICRDQPRCELLGARYGTDAATIAASGIPTVVFGPGSIEQAHTADEWIDVDQLETATELLCQIGRAGLESDS